MLVFRSNQQQPEPDFPEGIAFQVVQNGFEALRIAFAYNRFYGLAGTVKMVAKLLTVKRSYYVAMRGGRIVSDGWILEGWCSSYVIGARDYVIGPIQTASSERGLGLAYLCLVRGMNFCLARGAEWVYIDTTVDNHASRRTIEKGGMLLFKEIAV